MLDGTGRGNGLAGARGRAVIASRLRVSAPSLLIVDPDSELSSAVARFARNQGGQTVILGNRNGVVPAGISPELILLDICPNGVPDLEVVANLRRRNPKARIVVLTAYPSVNLAVAALRKGADDFLVKPLGPDEIWRKLQPGRSDIVDEVSQLPTLDRVVHEYTSRVLVQLGGNVSATARVLGIRRSTLQRRLRKYPSPR